MKALFVAFVGCLALSCTSPAIREVPKADPTAPGASIITADDISIVLSRQVTILDYNALGLRYFPDTAVTVLRRSPTFQMLLTAGTSSFLVEGNDLMRLTRAREVLTPGSSGSFDNGYAGISGAARVNDRLYAIYSAEDHEGLPKIRDTPIPGYYGSIALAESKDEGQTWSKLGRIITSAYPKNSGLLFGKAVQGVGEPGLVVESTGHYLYLYYTQHHRRRQICLARADLREGPPLPGRWRKYWGEDFSQPGLGGLESPIISVASGGALFPHPTYSVVLNRYLIVFNVDRLNDPNSSGIYVAHSKDGLRWSEPSRLVQGNSIPRMGEPLFWMGTILWDDEGGRDGWLVYAYSERWGNNPWGKDQYRGIPHYMVGRRILFEVR